MISTLILSAVLAVLPINTDSLYPKDIFYELTISANLKIDSLFSGEQMFLLVKINRLDLKFFRPGIKVRVPREFKDFDWTPLPKERVDLNDLAKAVVVDLNLQFLGAYEHGHLVFWSPISSGNPKIKNGKETPNGNFKITFKKADYRSRNFGVSMPYAMNFYGGFYIHVGDLPGYPASHGCVRMLYEEAKKLYQWTRNWYARDY